MLESWDHSLKCGLAHRMETLRLELQHISQHEWCCREGCQQLYHTRPALVWSVSISSKSDSNQRVDTISWLSDFGRPGNLHEADTLLPMGERVLLGSAYG